MIPDHPTLSSVLRNPLGKGMLQGGRCTFGCAQALTHSSSFELPSVNLWRRFKVAAEDGDTTNYRLQSREKHGLLGLPAKRGQ